MTFDFRTGIFEDDSLAMQDWFELGFSLDEVARILEAVGLSLEDAGSASAAHLLEHIASAQRLPVWLSKLPAVRNARASVRKEKADREARERAHSRAKRSAKTRAQRAGVRCWPALLNKTVSAPQVLAFEALLIREGWLSADWAPSKASEDAAWTVQMVARVGAAVGSREVRIAWEDAFPLIEELASNEAALALAISMRWQHSWVVPVDVGVSAPVARRMQEVAAQLVRDAGSAADEGLSNLSWIQWRAVARAPEQLRWALITGRTAPAKGEAFRRGELRALNWDQYQRARVSPGVRFGALPAVLQWTRMTGLPKPAGTLPSLRGLKVATLRKLLDVSGLTDPHHAVSAGNLVPILNLTRLFGDEAAVRRFVQARGLTWDRKGLHDAGQFVLPRAGWTPSKWAPLCLRHPQAVQYAREFAKLEQAGEVPQTWALLQTAALRITYPTAAPGSEALMDFCIKNKLSASVFDEAQSFWATTPVKSAEFMPHLKIVGAELGLSSDWVFERLASNDIRGPLLGHLTGCCQHLSGAGAPCARHGVTSPFSAFYVLTFKGKVFAQSWAWRSLQGGFVWDSVESRPATPEELTIVAAFYREANARLLQGPLCISAVYMGFSNSGITGQIHERLLPGERYPRIQRQRFADYCDYSDGRSQVLVAGTARKTGIAWAPVTDYTRLTDKAQAMPDAHVHDVLAGYYEMDPEATIELEEDGSLYAWVRGRRLQVRDAGGGYCGWA